MISCDETKQHMSDYLEDMSSEQERDNIKEHLSFCPACQRLYDRTVVMLRKISDLPETEVETGFNDKLEARLRQMRRQELNGNRYGFIKGAAVGAAAAGIIFVSYDQGMQTGKSDANAGSVNISAVNDSLQRDSLQTTQPNSGRFQDNLKMVNDRK
jgi:predicted anti-sigma-YlaC factor YlaD